MRDQGRTLLHEVHAAAEQIARFTQALGVDVGDGDVAAFEQPGDLLGVDVVVLGLAAVDRLHVQRMAEHEGNLLLPAQVGDPVPGEQTLDGDDHVGPEGASTSSSSCFSAGRLLLQDDGAGLIDDADGQEPCVQIDAAVELVWFGVESHHGLLGLGGA